ncbi:hypothetical protein [Paraburkholderia sacchari]|uniref:Uncharacterized protein n=1 Tax=Paraburkholderia sacchari TaxID=159450 RepID=A0A8T6ZIR5_9BURK|nr:hypothetical protein [Paraburkholderia sacchari]NLP64618.1 hypothetical protein [Paraburkholderia sacchari]
MTATQGKHPSQLADLLVSMSSRLMCVKRFARTRTKRKNPTLRRAWGCEQAEWRPHLKAAMALAA